MTTTRIDQSAGGLLLPGLDGTNPLGFLAALGVMRLVTLARQRSSVSMCWEVASGTWVPRLLGPVKDTGALMAIFDRHLVKTFDQHPLSRLSILDDRDTTQRRATMRGLVNVAKHEDRAGTEWLAALASDVVPPDANNQLQTARRDYFKGNLQAVIERTEWRHLERALFAIWDYADALNNQSLHFDPSEDHRHAHQWNQPSGDPDRKKSGGMLGANRLAIEALPLFVSTPERDRLHTLGFSGFRSDDTRWTWPLWRHPTDLETTRSLLAVREIQEEKVSANTLRHLRSRGVVAIFRTHRIMVGKAPNFTRAQPIA